MSHRYAAFALLLIIVSLLVGLVVAVLATGVGRHLRRTRGTSPRRLERGRRHRRGEDPDEDGDHPLPGAGDED